MVINGIDYQMQSKYFGTITKDSKQRILMGRQREAVKKSANAFIKIYAEWYVKARHILENAYAENKITNLQLTTFYDRQEEINRHIETIIKGGAITGEVYFDFAGFEKDYLGKYESREVYNLFCEIAEQIEKFTANKPLYEKIPVKLTRNSGYWDLDDKVTYASTWLLDGLFGEDKFPAYNDTNRYIAVKNGIEYQMKTDFFGVITINNKPIIDNYELHQKFSAEEKGFLRNYNYVYSDMRKVLERDYGLGIISEAQLNLFYARQPIIIKYLKIIFSACKTGKVFFDSTVFEAKTIGKLLSKEVFCMLESFVNYASYYGRLKNRMDDYVIKNDIVYQKKTNYFGIVTRESENSSLDTGLNVSIKNDAYIFIERYKANENSMESRLPSIISLVEQITKACLTGKFYFDFAGFEQEYVGKCGSKEIYNLLEKIVKQTKHFDYHRAFVTKNGLEYAMVTNYLGYSDPYSFLTKDNKEKVLAQANAFKSNYDKWFAGACSKLKKSLERKKTSNMQLYTFYTRQKRIRDAIDYICEKSATGRIYFDFATFEKAYKKEYPSKLGALIFQNIVTEIKQRMKD